jgi:hypothetical protein
MARSGRMKRRSEQTGRRDGAAVRGPLGRCAGSELLCRVFLNGS